MVIIGGYLSCGVGSTVEPWQVPNSRYVGFDCRTVAGTEREFGGHHGAAGSDRVTPVHVAIVPPDRRATIIGDAFDRVRQV